MIGGGLVGLSTAYALTRRGVRVTVVEKETQWASHQSGRNSGVVHSGVYYKPGSLKLALTRAGGEQLERFCAENGVAFRRTGKAIVATSKDELPRLSALAARAQANGVAVRQLSPGQLAEHEPHVRSVGALWVPDAGVCDYAGVAQALARRLEEAGAELLLGTQALRVYQRGGRAHVLVHGERTRAIATPQAVVCAGLYSDRLVTGNQAARKVRIVPFRGEYAELVPERSDLVRGLVYPVPDPVLPFLGVHLTRNVEGVVHVGPNAVPALSREGYRWRDVNSADVRESLFFAGTWRMAARNARYGVVELTRSLVRPAFVRAVRRLLPELRAGDLVPAPSGVRAQAVRPDGSLVEDFVFRRDGSILHVVNAPSPAATACLAIGEHVAGML